MQPHSENNINQLVPQGLPGTNPSTKEYTKLQVHKLQRMSLSCISERSGSWYYELKRFPSVGEGTEDREVVVGGCVEEHPHISRGIGDAIEGFQEG